MRIEEIADIATDAIRSSFHMRHFTAIRGEPGQSKIVSTRKHQIREWIAVLRVVSDASTHACVISRVTNNGEFSGRNLMAHDLRNLVILGGHDAKLQQAADRQGERSSDRHGA